MGKLFACLAESTVGTERTARHEWAKTVLLKPVDTFTELSSEELGTLINALECPPPVDYEACGELGPDGESCVLDAGHWERGEECADMLGRIWTVAG